jgi:hypothetical protein
LLGAGAYSLLWPTDVVSIEPETQGPALQSSPPVPSLRSDESLVAGLTNPFATGNLIGLDVLDKDAMHVGKITDLMLSRQGSVQGAIVGLSGYWVTKNYVVIPFKEFKWEYQASSDGVKAFVIERGTVPYNRRHLENLPPVGDPWITTGRGGGSH